MAGRPLHTFQVVRTEQLAPHMVRVILGGNGFDTFVPGGFTDSYVKFAFLRSDVDVDSLPRPLTMDSFAGLAPEHRPTVRTYTVRRADPQAREITVDFVVHGEHGVAGPWASSAQPGDTVIACGKGHEQSMCFGTTEYPWDDRAAMRQSITNYELRITN